MAFRRGARRKESPPTFGKGGEVRRDQTPVLCETPTPGRQATRIARWKYDLLRQAILDAVPLGAEGLAFKDLPREVERRLAADERDGLGSVSWYTTVVKLDLEVKGELRRLPGSPQRLVRA